MMLQTSEIVEMVHRVRMELTPKTVIGLTGAMGAGKTTFVSELFKSQNVSVASPTYALHHTYRAFGQTIVHVDLYRAETADEIESSGFWDLFANTTSVILVEWIGRIDVQDLPLDWKKIMITIDVDLDGRRTYTLV